MRTWLTSEFPIAHKIQVYYFPQGFLTAVLQNHSRKYMIEIDALDFVFKTYPYVNPDDMKDKPVDGVLIYGL